MHPVYLYKLVLNLDIYCKKWKKKGKKEKSSDYTWNETHALKGKSDIGLVCVNWYHQVNKALLLLFMICHPWCSTLILIVTLILYYCLNNCSHVILIGREIYVGKAGGYAKCQWSFDSQPNSPRPILVHSGSILLPFLLFYLVFWRLQHVVCLIFF